MSSSQPDRHGESFFEVRHEGNVVGPVTRDQIRRARAAGKIPEEAQARSVGKWLRVHDVLGPSGMPIRCADLPGHAPLEVRHEGNVVGPVTLDQVRRGRIQDKVPEGAQLRPVGPWRPVDTLLRAVERAARTKGPPPLRRPTSPTRPAGHGRGEPPAPPPRAARDAETESPRAKTQRWRLQMAEGDPVILVDTDQLADGLVNGAIRLSAEVCPIGGDGWVPVWDVPELADAIRDLPPATLRGMGPAKAARWWLLKLPGGKPSEPIATAQVIEQIRTGSVPLSARVCAVDTARWLPVWDVPEFADAIQGRPPAAWRAQKKAQELMDQAESSRDATEAIRLYASAMALFIEARAADEALDQACARINARARGMISTLLAEGRPRQARVFLDGIREEMLVAGLDDSVAELDWRVKLALAQTPLANS